MTTGNLGGVRVRIRLPASVPAWLTASKRRLAGTSALVTLGLLFLAGTGYGYEPYERAISSAPATAAADHAELPTLARLRARERQLRGRVAQSVPRGRYIVVDQTNNRLYLRDSDEILIDAVCSAGSGFVLKEGGGGDREWVFDTPRGKFQVLTRIRDPIWRKPDWAFIEEGKPIPANVEDRLEPGTLGEFGLYFGNGFLIHGTLYERLLGRSVTHGCIRLGRNDLRALWEQAPIGTPIYIF
jgi:L,D-transpeptidase YbiS